MKCVSLTATGLDQITGDGQVFVDVMLLLRCSITFFFLSSYLNRRKMPSGKTCSRKRKTFQGLFCESYKGGRKKKINKLIHIKQGCTHLRNISKKEDNGDRAGRVLLLQFTASGISLTLASKLSFKRGKSHIML